MDKGPHLLHGMFSAKCVRTQGSGIGPSFKSAGGKCCDSKCESIRIHR